MLELLVKESAVREPRERIVERLTPKLFLRLALGRDVEQVALEIERSPVVAADDDTLVADPDDVAG